MHSKLERPFLQALPTTPRTCDHKRGYIHLDGAYCPDCKQTFLPRSKTYNAILLQNQFNSITATKLCFLPLLTQEVIKNPPLEPGIELTVGQRVKDKRFKSVNSGLGTISGFVATALDPLDIWVQVRWDSGSVQRVLACQIENPNPPRKFVIGDRVVVSPAAPMWVGRNLTIAEISKRTERNEALNISCWRYLLQGDQHLSPDPDHGWVCEPYLSLVETAITPQAELLRTANDLPPDVGPETLSWLQWTSFNDLNFKSNLHRANLATIEYCLLLIRERPEGNKGRIKALERQAKKLLIGHRGDGNKLGATLPLEQTENIYSEADQAEALHDAIAQLEQERSRIKGEGEIAPDGCWLERAKCSKRNCYQVFYRSNQPIFEPSRKRDPSGCQKVKRKYVGMAGSPAVQAAEQAIARRNQLERLQRQIEILEKGTE